MPTPSPTGRNRPVRSLLGAGLAALMLVLSSPGVSHADSGDESRIPPAVAALADALPARDASPEDVAKVARAIGWELTRTQPGATAPLMPAGSRCEGAELVDGVLIVRFSVPPGTVLDEDDVETAHMVFTRFVAGPLELSETRIEVREMPGPGAIRSTTDFAPMHTFAPEPPPVPEPVVNEDEPPGFPGPDYKTLYAELRRAADEARTRAITGQSPVATGAQPTGALTGRTIYFSAGHGIALITAGTWNFGRAFIQGMNEDLGNVDQTNFFAEAVFNAGGTVVCMRPIGQQTNEVVLDNTSSDVTWTPSIGSWTLSASSTDNFGDSTGNNMRSISTAATETATATYTPNIPQAGFYPVYCFANASSNRCSGQLYRVKHSAGETQVRVNHRRVGRGWVWLGTYYFSAGKNPATGSVVISNLEPPAGTAGLVIADAIRFGNGMGSIVRNGRLSGQEREAEGSRYWAQISEAPSSVWDSVAATTSDPNNFNDTSDNVSTPARMAAYMWNNDGQGYNGDIYLGFHTNATGNGARGSIGLITSAATVVNQPRWATLVSDVLDAMCLIEDDNWESTWFNRASATYTSSYGEIGAALGGRMCGTIVEVAFHDDPIDSKLLRDPKVRYVAARSQVHAAIRYFNEFDSNPIAYPPVPPQRVRATNVAGGIRVAWAPVAASPAGPQAATGYRVYTSPDGLNYRLATELAGYTNTQTTLAGIPSGDVLYVRVSATNAGGESSPSETLAARSTAGATPPVLVVSGYDRIDRFNNVPRFPSNPEASSGERLFVRRNNSYDYARMAAASITAAGRWFDMVDNESVIAGDVSLGTYATVVWMTGEEAEKDRTLDSTERTRLQTFLGLANKSLFISGANIANELDTQNVARSFYNTWLRADDAGRTTRNYVAEGAAGSALAGVSVAFPPGPDMYDVAAADILAPLGGATVAMNYGGAGGGTTVLEPFEAQGGWWDPNNSGTTNADASSTFEMTTTRVREGARSGQIYYAWGSGNTLRVYNSSQSPVPSNATISLWVYGDNSGNSFSILVRDTVDTELFENTPITLNFTGWQQITWNLQSDPRTRFFGTGDNAITNPTVAFDSLLVRKVGAAATGTIHVDDATYSTAGGASPSPAAVQYSGAYRLVNFGFPFEAISGDSERTQVMQKVLDYLGAPPAAAVADWHLY